MPDASANVTQLLAQLRAGDREVLDDLFPLVYDELRRRAHYQLRGERPGHTLSTTALVHEAYFKLVDHHAVDWEDRSHFYAVAAHAMRQVLIDRARKRSAQKRGGDAPKLSLEDVTPAAPAHPTVLLALDAALRKLEQMDPRQGQIVECRFFAGYTIQETADILDVSPSTVKRDWRTAKAYLAYEMQA